MCYSWRVVTLIDKPVAHTCSAVMTQPVVAVINAVEETAVEGAAAVVGTFKTFHCFVIGSKTTQLLRHDHRHLPIVCVHVYDMM